MLGKFGILITLLILVFVFYLVISFGAVRFSKKEKNEKTKKIFKISKYFAYTCSGSRSYFSFIFVKNIRR